MKETKKTDELNTFFAGDPTNEFLHQLRDKIEEVTGRRHRQDWLKHKGRKGKKYFQYKEGLGGTVYL